MKFKHEKIIKKNYLEQLIPEHSYEKMDLCYRLASIVANHSVNKRKQLKLSDIKPTIKVKQKIRIDGKLRDFYSSFYSSMTSVVLYIRLGSISSYFKIIWPENEA